MTVALPALTIEANGQFQVTFDPSTPYQSGLTALTNIPYTVTMPTAPVKGVILENYSGYILTIRDPPGSKYLPPYTGQYYPVSTTIGTIIEGSVGPMQQQTGQPTPLILPTLVLISDPDPPSQSWSLAPAGVGMELTDFITPGTNPEVTSLSVTPSQNAQALILACQQLPNTIQEVLTFQGAPGNVIINLPYGTISPVTGLPPPDPYYMGLLYIPVLAATPYFGSVINIVFVAPTYYLVWEIDSPNEFNWTVN